MPPIRQGNTLHHAEYQKPTTAIPPHGPCATFGPAYVFFRFAAAPITESGINRKMTQAGTKPSTEL